MIPKPKAFRDPAWIKRLHDMPCILTGWRGNDVEGVDPMHIGTLGKSIKSPDNQVLPVRHSLHAEGHANGEMTMFRKHMPDWLLRAALRAYAEKFYEENKDERKI